MSFSSSMFDTMMSEWKSPGIMLSPTVHMAAAFQRKMPVFQRNSPDFTKVSAYCSSGFSVNDLTV